MNQMKKSQETCFRANKGNLKIVLFLPLCLWIINYFASMVCVSVNYWHIVSVTLGLCKLEAVMKDVVLFL